jgi:Catalase
VLIIVCFALRLAVSLLTLVSSDDLSVWWGTAAFERLRRGDAAIRQGGTLERIAVQYEWQTAARGRAVPRRPSACPKQRPRGPPRLHPDPSPIYLQFVPSSAYDSRHWTTNQGLPVWNNNSSVTVGERGPILLEDYQLVEKLANFDRERIPERVVHARGASAKGFFEVRTHRRSQHGDGWPESLARPTERLCTDAHTSRAATSHAAPLPLLSGASSTRPAPSPVFLRALQHPVFSQMLPSRIMPNTSRLLRAGHARCVQPHVRRLPARAGRADACRGALLDGDPRARLARDNPRPARLRGAPPPPRALAVLRLCSALRTGRTSPML